ncbi:MAG: hypothetical protein F6K50_32665 [Moorea sp. SIO3I7]|uniref:hypothetical protein n=1 Tax=Moorena sp. SIO4A1 TaxID=2607835 RepID=UPI0013CDC7D2|nr:hypothetical protein [Moorena sp. SIO4A1]NEO00054.1 hypothetical protein [Moorena sp. SIO3I7]NEQ63693.1 hypothetical protein [Moorena sp. SIO4A1]
MKGSKDGMNAIGLGHVTRLTYGHAKRLTYGHATRTHFLLEAIPSFDTPLPLTKNLPISPSPHTLFWRGIMK